MYTWVLNVVVLYKVQSVGAGLDINGWNIELSQMTLYRKIHISYYFDNSRNLILFQHQIFSHSQKHSLCFPVRIGKFVIMPVVFQWKQNTNLVFLLELMTQQINNLDREINLFSKFWSSQGVRMFSLCWTMAECVCVIWWDGVWVKISNEVGEIWFW